MEPIFVSFAVVVILVLFLHYQAYLVFKRIYKLETNQDITERFGVVGMWIWVDRLLGGAGNSGVQATNMFNPLRIFHMFSLANRLAKKYGGNSFQGMLILAAPGYFFIFLRGVLAKLKER
ncbi:MAG: hypothetical protein R3313_00650 [Candidatus Saccharimonadales bacterium]|nr:hypothetical protein [Candidatus Saccharimonadales bacterium]